MSPAVFDSLARDARGHQAHEAGLPGRVDQKTRRCHVCREETTNDRYCDDCVAGGVHLRTCIRCGQTYDAYGPQRFASDDYCLACLTAIARADERAATLDERCRIYRVRRVEDLPVSVLEEMQAERGRS